LQERHLILGIGELLWDLLPEGELLGGAPANFAVMAGRLGNHAAILSRVGRDDLGREALLRLESMPVDGSFLQIDPGHDTGRVTVQLEAGQPSYTIHHPAAWDFLELTDSWVQLAERADAICFGSLAQRSQESRQTIQTLVAQTRSACVRVFDVNLRAPYYSCESLVESLELASVVKMNDAELPLLLALVGLPEEGERPQDLSLRQGAARLMGEFPTVELVAVTRGSQGSLLVGREEWHEHPGIGVAVADTVGAGDAFTAALTHGLLQGADLATLNEVGNRCGAWVASQTGAMPELPEAVQAEIAAALQG
jgi:fructokinase